VNADIPLVAIAFIGVCKAAGCVVLLEYADFPAEFAEKCGGREAAHARADDNGIVVRSEPAGSISITDT
jgi:hypothetical protein